MNPTLKLLIDEIRIRSTAQENAINLIVRLLVAKGLFERQEIDQATRIALQHLEASDEEESFKTKAAIHFQYALSLDDEKPKPAPPKFHGKSK
jgi:hypothetical protein